MKVLGVIPARMESRRFPGKPLAKLSGRPLIEHVWAQAKRAGSLARVVVATDSPELARAARDFGAEVVVTDRECATGTDRAAQVLDQVDPGFDLVVNWQADEPLLAPEAVDHAVSALRSDSSAAASTLAFEDDDRDAFQSRQVVKVVCDSCGHALFFSRAPIGAAPSVAGGASSAGVAGGATFLRHVGLYVFRAAALREFASWSPTPLERAEGLEQLRLLEHGLKMRVAVTSHRSRAVDTPDDLAALERDRHAWSGSAAGTARAPGEATP